MDYAWFNSTCYHPCGHNPWYSAVFSLLGGLLVTHRIEPYIFASFLTSVGKDEVTSSSSCVEKLWEQSPKNFIYVIVIFSPLLNLTASFCCLAAALNIVFQLFPMLDLKNVVCSFIRLMLFLRERLRLLPTLIKGLVVAKITFCAFHNRKLQEKQFWAADGNRRCVIFLYILSWRYIIFYCYC